MSQQNEQNHRNRWFQAARSGRINICGVHGGADHICIFRRLSATLTTIYKNIPAALEVPRSSGSVRTLPTES